MKKVEIGDLILATDENIKYEVSGIWGKGISEFIDFSGKRLKPVGVDQYGNPVVPGRGFSYSNNNWVKLNSEETK